LSCRIFCCSWAERSATNASNSRGLGHSFAVGEVGAHHDRIAVAQVLHNLDDVVLGIRTDPDVALENGARPFGQLAADPRPPSPHAAALVEMAHEMGHPFGAELRGHHVDIGEPAEEVVEDECGQRVLNRPFAPAVLPLPGGHLEEHRLGVEPPGRTEVFVVPELPDVVRHTCPGFVDPGPEGVEVGITRRAPVGRPGVEHDERGPETEHVVKLSNRLVEIPERQDGWRVDAAVVIEAPGLVQPPVVRVQVRIERPDPSDVVLGHGAHGRRIEDGALDPLAVHEGETRLPLEVLGAQWLQGVTVGGLAGLHLAQHRLQGPGPVGHVDRVIQPGHQTPAGQQALFAVGQCHRGDGAVEVLLGEEPGDRIGGLVNMVVAVEQRDRAHGYPFLRLDSSAAWSCRLCGLHQPR
jgi:hypothetical protein